ncbi:hypothetical protein FHR99_002995 [Litorivivens lipolytica]|uniref:Uncharacterized protein n=1 Tax=Litorivivens lipolytica TaxID=1524264 RepID=A0A7W4Z889_9GAMM|nr:hypothetical protein [Litorivivens lipolytica]MBB3048721.1 hypothetical protein [Litorivivens lipolytica]
MIKIHKAHALFVVALLSFSGLFSAAAFAQDADSDFASGTFQFFDIIVPQPKAVIQKLLPPGYTLAEAPNVLTKGENNHVLLLSLGQVIESTMYDSAPLPSFYDVKLSIPYVKAPGIKGLVVYDIAYFFENPAMCFGVFAECQPSTVSMSYGDSGAFSVRRNVQDVFSAPLAEGSYQLDSEHASTALVKAVDTYVNTQPMLGSSPLSCNTIPSSAYPSCLEREDRFSDASMGPRTHRVNLKLKLAEFGCQAEGLPDVLEVENVIAIEGIMPFRAGTPQTCPAE